MSKLTKKSFKQVVLENGSIPIGTDGSLYFIITQVNTENFPDMTEKLIKQLKDENKYNSWIGIIDCLNQGPYNMSSLPIYGDPNKYVTHHFTYSAEEAIDLALGDRQMKLLKRANEHISNL